MNKHLTEHNEIVYIVLRSCCCLSTCILKRNLIEKKVIAFNEKKKKNVATLLNFKFFRKGKNRLILKL